MPGCKVPAALDGSLVSHVDDPGACRAFCTVEDGALALDEEEEILDEIVGLGCVPEDAVGNAANDPDISLEQEP